MACTTVDLEALMRDAVAFGVEHVERGGIPFVGVVVGEDVARLGFDYRSSYRAARIDRTGLAGSTMFPLTVPDGLAPFHRYLAQA